ncbi:hypothetical protein [Thermocrinis sp.]
MAYALKGNLECFAVLVKHEIGELKRIKRELKLVDFIPAVECFSIALVELPYLEPSHHQSILSSMRASDVIVFWNKFILAFLPGTNKEGAIHLLEGIKDFFSEEGNYAIATFPEDGDSYESLVESLKIYAKDRGIEKFNWAL